MLKVYGTRVAVMEYGHRRNCFGRSQKRIQLDARYAKSAHGQCGAVAI
jgi:hypothetical protein